MQKILLLSVMLFIVISPLNASVYKGQKYFKKKCLSCHGKAMQFVTEKSYDSWLEYLDESGDTMHDIHEESDEAKASMKYFNSPKYRKSMRHFRDFFLEYAADTGNIPACE